MILTEKIFEEAKSERGGWSARQVRLLGEKTFLNKGWKKRCLGKEFPDEVVAQFIALKDRHINFSDAKKIQSVRKQKKKKRHKKQFSSLDKLARKAYLMKGTYQDFLKTKYWYEVRKLVFARDGKICRVCKAESNLEVHHDTYKNHFREHKHLEDLIVLCRTCHQDYHDNIEDK